MLTLEQIRNLKIGDTIYFFNNENKVIECTIDALSYDKVNYSTDQSGEACFEIKNFDSERNRNLYFNNPLINNCTTVDQFIIKRPDYISDNVIERLKQIPLCLFPIKIKASTTTRINK